jgi:phosphatidylserine/phosphatidylglycerophosphate/cardiolipin synthase-like enzyme
MVLNFQRNHDTTIESDLVARLANDFWKRQWPGGEPRPTLWYDPRGIAKDQASRASMHAKVVVIDRRKAFITSANLTARAQSDNIELGVLIQHPAIARRIVEYFDALMAQGLLVRA